MSLVDRFLSRRGALRTLLTAAAAGVTLRGARAQGASASSASGEVLREFIYDDAEFPSCHASTIVEVDRDLVAAWFGGTAEGRDDVSIYVARRDSRGWSAPMKVAEGIVEGDLRRYPCWNPVLFHWGRRGPLFLFYKVGPRPHNWWGMLCTSEDGGRTWSAPRRLPEGFLGPVRAKPVRLRDGTLLCGSSTEHDGWRVHMELTRDPLGEWRQTEPLNTADEWGAIQPTILVHRGRKIQILCRSRQQVILEAWSEDGGRTWSKLTPTSLPNPSSGIDAVRLRDGRHLLVYNHTRRGREKLNIALSRDGREWFAAVALEDEPGEFSYPAVIQDRDRMVHVTYTWNRKRIRHVVLDPSRLPMRPMPGGNWPA